MLALIVVALMLIFGLVIMMFLIRSLTRNQTYVTDPSGKTLSPVESSGGPVKSSPDTDGISVVVPGESKSSPPKHGSKANHLPIAKTPSEEEKVAKEKSHNKESPYVKSNKKVEPPVSISSDDDDEHREGLPPKLKLPATTASLKGIKSIEKISKKEKKSLEIVKSAEKRDKHKENTGSDGSAAKEKKPIVPGNHDWTEMKKQMATATSPSVASTSSKGSIGSGNKQFRRDSDDSISSSDSFGPAGKLVKKRNMASSSDSLGVASGQVKSSSGSLDLKNTASKDVKGNISHHHNSK